jgi:hypothetical protein
MTLYWGYKELKGLGSFLPSNIIKIGKVENIVQFSKPLKDEKNNNIYALVGDTLDIYCLGMVKEQAPKYNGKLFIGQKVYATSKEELFLYYREAVKKHRGALDAAMKKAEEKLSNKHLDTCSTGYIYRWARIEIERLKVSITQSESQYKQLIEDIKKL